MWERSNTSTKFHINTQTDKLKTEDPLISRTNAGAVQYENKDNIDIFLLLELEQVKQATCLLI